MSKSFRWFLAGSSIPTSMLTNYIRNDEYATDAHKSRVHILQKDQDPIVVDQIHGDFNKISEWREQAWYKKIYTRPIFKRVYYPHN